MVVGWLVLYIWDKGKSAYSTSNVPQKTSDLFLANAEKDTDNDGLKDWEEELWRTDLIKIDSDGDGASDGEEVKAGRNPKITGICPEQPEQIEGCTDKLQSPEEITKKNNSNSTQTFTAKIAEDFGKNYFAGKGLVSGGSLSASAQQSLADSIALGIEQGTAAYQDIFKKEDIKISKSLEPKEYLNKLGNGFSKNFSAIGGKNIPTELDIINLIISDEHFKNTKLFDPLIEAYKNMSSYLQKEIVPESYAELHLEMLNIMQNTLFAIRNMKEIEEDPAKAIVGIRLYAKESERTEEFLKKLKSQVEKDKIKFTEQEGGWFFMKYFEQI